MSRRALTESSELNYREGTRMFKPVHWIQKATPTVRYIAAIALAMAGPATRIPLHLLHFTPLVPYAPFIVVSAIVLGLGPGLFTTLLCMLEAMRFAIQATGSFAGMAPANWERIAVVGFTGVFASVMADRLKLSSGQLKQAHDGNIAILERISD